MAHLVGDLAKYFQIDEINIDNWYFKLFYKGCTLVYFIGSMVGLLSQYFGDPINCDFSGVDSQLASDYCWIHGSGYIPRKYQPHMKCITNLDGVEYADEGESPDMDTVPDTSYYQWVTFMQLFQAAMFYLPYYLWSHLEDGLLESFGKDAKSAVLLKDEDKYSEGVVMGAVVEKYVRYFRSIQHHCQWYFAKFLVCETLNFLLLFLNFWATDQFLNGKFKWYGLDVMQYYQMSVPERKHQINPMCAVFPTEVSCTVPNIGAAGGEQNHNGLCVLSQNIINEKIYLIIWWYLSVLVILSVVFTCYRLCTLFFDQLRFALIYAKIANKYDEDVRRSLRFVLARCYIGDWFVLYQLLKNTNHYFYKDFIKELRNDLKRAPKFSRSESARAEKARSKNSIEVQKGDKKVEDTNWDSDMETLKIR